MNRLPIWLVILLALALAAVTGIVLVLGELLLPIVVALGFLAIFICVGAFLARSKHFWLVGVLGAAIGAAAGLLFWGELKPIIGLSVSLCVLALIMRAFFSAVKNSGTAWRSSSYFDRELEEIAYFSNQPTGFFAPPAPPARSFQRKDSAATSAGHASTGSADAEKVHPAHLKEDGSS